MSAVVWLEHRRYFLPYLLWAAVVAAPLVGFNWAVYHSALSPYYLASRIGHGGRFAEASLGTLREPRPRAVRVLAHLAAVRLRRCGSRSDDAASWTVRSLPSCCCTGSRCRRFRTGGAVTPSAPVCSPTWCRTSSYFLIPVVARIASLSGARRTVWVTGFACLVAVSFLVNFRGATARAVYRWNAEPVDVDVQPARLVGLARSRSSCAGS